MSFLGEIKRRKVFQVAAVYAVVAWLIIQIIDVVTDPLSLPGWLDTVVIVLLAVGFPIAVILAWAFDLTPEGVMRDQGSSVVVQSGGRRIEYVLIGLLILAMGWVLYRVEITPSEPAVEVVAEEAQRTVLPNSVAVLPFRSLSPDPNDAFYADGIHIELLNLLHKIRGVTAIARDSVIQLRDATLSNVEIAQRFRVQTVMRGDVRYAGESVRVFVELIDPKIPDPVWSGIFNGNRSDLFAFQVEIATNIAMALQAELLPSEQQNIAKTPTNSPEAYEYYLRAKILAPNIGGFFGDYAAFHGYLDRAIELDANYAEAMALKAGEYAFAATRPSVPGYESFSLAYREALALGFAEKALSIDPNLGLGHMALGLMHRFNWRGADAVAEFERAYQLSPSNDDILDDYGRILSLTGQHEDAISIARRTAELRPNYIGLPDFLWRAGRYQEAADLVRAALAYREAGQYRIDDSPDHDYIFLGMFELLLGNDAAARAALRVTDGLVPGIEIFGETLALRTYLYGRLGDRAEAMLSFRMIDTELTDVYPAERVLAYLGIGDEEQALEWLTYASENRRPENWSASEVDIAFNSYADPILDQPEFVEVRSRLGFRE